MKWSFPPGPDFKNNLEKVDWINNEIDNDNKADFDFAPDLFLSFHLFLFNKSLTKQKSDQQENFLECFDNTANFSEFSWS